MFMLIPALIRPGFPLSRLTLSVFALFGAQAISQTVAAGSLYFEPSLPGLTGAPNSSAFAISADGSTVVGYASPTLNGGPNAVKWTSSGVTDLGTLSGGSYQYSHAFGVSSDGSVIVGDSTNAQGAEAMRWTSTGGMEGLGYLPGATDTNYGGISYGKSSRAGAVSADGAVIVGSSNNSAGKSEAFRWVGGVMTGLGYLGGASDQYASSGANAVSSDGSVVVGSSWNASSTTEAFRWVGGAMTGLGNLSGKSSSSATGVSANGAVVVGSSGIGPHNNEAFIWTAGSGMTGLGFLPGKTESTASAISGDGLVVVGSSSAAFFASPVAFRWTNAGGMQSVTQWLADNGVSVASGLVLTHANGANQDGSVVVGTTNVTDSHGVYVGQQAWIARTNGTFSGSTTPGEGASGASGGGSGSTVSNGGTGLIYVDDFNVTLQTLSQIGQSTAQALGLSLWGAHHRPLLDNGMHTVTGNGFWATGDLARHESSNSDHALGEIGIWHDVSSTLRVGAGLGLNGVQQDLDVGGSAKVNNPYFVFEAGYVPSQFRGLSVSVTGMIGNGDAEIRRGYLNAGLPDISVGSPNASTWALRARLDWNDVASLGSFRLSPFVSYGETHGRLDAYTETGGGFPVAFNEQKYINREARFGVVGKRAISENDDLRLSVEAAHSESDGSTINGQVIGLYAFSFAANNTHQDWIRAGIEIDHRLANDALVSASLNAASKGSDASYVASISYKAAF